MKTVTQKEAFSRGLPKWPQLLITGKPVTATQAKDIIFRTDSFMSAYHYGGNNHEWNEWVNAVLGRAELEQIEKADFNRAWQIKDKLNVELKFVSTEYIRNDWMSSSYIYGPHGWCSPDGIISHVDNVGKWPGVEEVYKDLVEIAKAFPYLVMTATLFDQEHCEDEIEKNPVITFIIRKGKVKLTDEHTEHHFDVPTPDRSDASMLRRFTTPSSEQGVPDNWIMDWEDEYSSAVKRAIAAQEAEELLEQTKESVD